MGKLRPRDIKSLTQCQTSNVVTWEWKCHYTAQTLQLFLLQWLCLRLNHSAEKPRTAWHAAVSGLLSRWCSERKDPFKSPTMALHCQLFREQLGSGKRLCCFSQCWPDLALQANLASWTQPGFSTGRTGLTWLPPRGNRVSPSVGPDDLWLGFHETRLSTALVLTLFFDAPMFMW